jgi:hypothetical protein
MLIRGERTAATAPTGTGCADRACEELPMPLARCCEVLPKSHRRRAISVGRADRRAGGRGCTGSPAPCAEPGRTNCNNSPHSWQRPSTKTRYGAPTSSRISHASCCAGRRRSQGIWPWTATRASRHDHGREAASRRPPLLPAVYRRPTWRRPTSATCRSIIARGSRCERSLTCRTGHVCGRCGESPAADGGPAGGDGGWAGSQAPMARRGADRR